jgi:CheY-like chemotaxis protein
VTDRYNVLVIDDSPTILKVVQLVLTKAGFRVVTAEDGEQGILRAKEERPSLILLDFVMPRMNGYQVCRALADDEHLKDVPVVLMSAKGDQVGERFVKVMGIVDYITKPFSPEAITAVVQHTIEKYAVRGAGVSDGDNETTGETTGQHNREDDDGEITGRAALATGGAAAESTDSGIETIEEITAPGRGKDGARPSSTGGVYARRLDAIAAFREGLTELLSGDDAVPDLGDRVRQKLDDVSLERLLEAAARAFASTDDGPALTGHLAKVPVAEVLTLLAAQRQWGTLTVMRPPGASTGDDGGAARVDIYFKNGKVELCLADGLGEEFLVGRYLVEQQAVPRQDLELFLRSRDEGSSPRDRKGPRKPIGEQLVKLGYCADADVKAALARQAQERLYEVLRWPAGRFTFTATRELPPPAIEAGLALDVDGILMEGFRRVDEWHLIEREVDDFDAVFLRNEEAVQNVGRARLTREELAVLELVNGKHTVKDIVRQSRMGSFDVSKMLFRLLSIKLIRRRVSPVAV